MFGRIANRYDLANRLLSGGLDVLWRRAFVRAVEAHRPRRVLDLATGSGDVAFALRRKLGPEVEIVGMDFSQPMLDEAIRKQKARPFGPEIPFLQGDILNLPVESESFDAVTISFGLRNLENRDQGLREMCRVLRPEGNLHILEFSRPRAIIRPFYYFHLKYILPTLGGWIAGDPSAYTYLGDTIHSFPNRFQLSHEITNVGFSEVVSRGLSLSIVAHHRARR